MLRDAGAGSQELATGEWMLCWQAVDTSPPPTAPLGTGLRTISESKDGGSVVSDPWECQVGAPWGAFA